ncbi:unnamed protein product [Cuscuta epithymum]|uniref:Uncharacterized protein n=1 Tax=Cuscuta epithymum TaxID=186058 RepID=A0AAV0D1D0_9ASTE|nr:unnamed protein product [Cuscuta epithymum]
MKFGKDFKKQQVPEWIEAYVDYNGLKRILHDIWHIKKLKQPPTPVQQKLPFYRALGSLNQESSAENSGDVEDQVISVDTVQEENSIELYFSKYLKSAEGGGQNEITFFKKLDSELNKVNAFYKKKVEEVKSEAALLNQQMDALLALRIKVMNPDFDASASLQRLSVDINNSIPSRVSSRNRATDLDTEHIALAPRVDHSPESLSTNHAEYSSALARNTNLDNKETDPMQILDHVKIVNTCESPMSTIRGVLRDSKENDLRFKKEELKKVDQRLKMAFIEFYRKLRLLKNFSYTNLSAFSKILKKYEKITSRRAARSYMRMVENSYLGSSDEVCGLLDSAESTFIKHFSNSNRRKGMKKLRPMPKPEKHRVTFFSGFFSGCSIALLVAVTLLRDTRKLMEGDSSYLDNIFPLYSFYAYIVLHMLLYAANLYFWRHYKINYAFIFGFKQGTELSYREVFLLSNGLAMLVLGTFLAHVHMNIESRSEKYNRYLEFIPLGLVVVLFILLFCPFNIIYRSSRFFLIRTVSHRVCAPLYKVTLPDFFLTDQLTSQVEAIRTLEYYVCYYGWHNPKERQNKCHGHDMYDVFYFILAFFPYWFRFLQCIRRLFEENDIAHLYNGLRYFLTIVAVAVRTAFELKGSLSWKVLAILMSVLATLLNTYWDIVVDWGLLRRKSRNVFLRNKLIVSHASVYFTAMVLDVALRFAWLQVVLKFNVASLRGNRISSIFSCLEILRRGMWNFFRLENEHLNNVGKYRAFKSVPLPFSYHDEDGDKDE